MYRSNEKLKIDLKVFIIKFNYRNLLWRRMGALTTVLNFNSQTLLKAFEDEATKDGGRVDS